jgi:predicted pyridoxine 5'-phosphate oxidase superfamily flavin-nucleotide-binding protein
LGERTVRIKQESAMTSAASDIAFTPAVKAVQTRRGSRGAYAKREAAGGFQTEITPDLVEFLSAVDTAYLATANAEGRPYAQHRGGPRGFIRVVGQRTLGFADFKGNRQYVTTGNLSENDKAFLFLMDYAHRRRVKIWGRARVSEDPEVIDALMPEGFGPARNRRFCSTSRPGTSIARSTSRRRSTRRTSPARSKACRNGSQGWRRRTRR